VEKLGKLGEKLGNWWGKIAIAIRFTKFFGYGDQQKPKKISSKLET
jgi:hypothetical protein